MRRDVRSKPCVLDTWPHFLETAADSLQSPTAFLAAWHDRYLSRWPSLRRIVVDRLLAEGAEWRETRARWVHPIVSDKLPAMRRARASLLAVIPKLDADYRAVVGRRARMRYVILVDLGHGGIPVRYRGGPAILLGLTSAAHMNWQTRAPLRDHVAHELGHCVQDVWRRRARIAEWSWTPLDTLHAEGFAQRMGELIGGGRWEPITDVGWVQGCRLRLGDLAAGLLAAIRGKGDLRPFFASWHQADGLSMTGYFMGYEFIRSLEAAGMSLKEIARLKPGAVKARAMAFLRSASQQ
ncbi:MAG: hypothetical protein JSV79_02240 [Armatimonadota bacterium]|nr:MAG: hypothetical protein JSV79_02240 [Armatimonadota bacterium]